MPHLHCFRSLQERSEGQSLSDKTAIELLLSGVRALASQSSIIDVVRMFTGPSSATGGH
jgi:hypothetical protein